MTKLHTGRMGEVLWKRVNEYLQRIGSAVGTDDVIDALFDDDIIAYAGVDRFGVTTVTYPDDVLSHVNRLSRELTDLYR